MNTITINTEQIREAVYNLCILANTHYSPDLYKKLADDFTKNAKIKTGLILKNIELASKNKRPLCQDTGQVIVFIKTGQNIRYEGKPINEAINNGVEEAYEKNYYRKSVVKDAINDRNNTKTNTPAIIYHDFVEGSETEINILIKGAGAENYSALKMFKPSDSKEKIFEFIKETVKTAGEKACPPIVVGAGLGGTCDFAAILSKKAFFASNNERDEQLEKELQNYLNGESVLDVKVITSPTHIASLPVCVTLNCHCTRHACAVLDENGIAYKKEDTRFLETSIQSQGTNVNADDYEKIRSLKKGDEILLSGDIYTARDAAHKKFEEIIDKGEELPFDMENKIIFYSGPCPAAPGEIIGPIGPTTAARMDGFAQLTHSLGLIASIGKGERSQEAQEAIKKYNGKYFSAIGGISCVLSQCVKKAEIVAFEELGAEAVYKLTVCDLPLKTEI